MSGRWRKQPGFTLIELMVSLAIFSIISLAVYATFASGIGAWRRARGFSSVYQTARLLLSDIAHELKNAVMISGSEFVGAPQKISFLVLRQSPYMTGRPGNHAITRVTYEVRRASSGYYSLVRLEASDIENPKEQGEPELMAGAISNLDFQYTYKNSEGEIQPWKDLWDVDDAIPLGVKISLMIGEARFTKMVFIPHGYKEEEEDKPKG